MRYNSAINITKLLRGIQQGFRDGGMDYTASNFDFIINAINENLHEPFLQDAAHNIECLDVVFRGLSEPHLYVGDVDE